MQLEGVRRRQHVWQIRRVVGNFVDVEEHRAGNVAGEVFVEALAVVRGQVPGTVDDRNVAFLDPIGELIGRDQPAALVTGDAHAAFPHSRSRSALNFTT